MNYEKYFKNKDTMSSQYIDLLKSSGLFYEKSDDVWLHSIKDILPLSKGFKIHISALITNATKILEMFLYFIEKHDILLNFKVVKSLNELENQNSGGNGFSQIGKFITIYPSNDKQFVWLLKSLYCFLKLKQVLRYHQILDINVAIQFFIDMENFLKMITLMTKETKQSLKV